MTFVDNREEFARILTERQADVEGDRPHEELLVDGSDRNATSGFIRPRGPRYVKDRLVFYRLAAGVDQTRDFDHMDALNRAESPLTS